MVGSRVGVAQVRITPQERGATAGYGPGLATTKAGAPERPEEELFATAVAMEDASGKRVVFVTADVHSGSRRVWQEAAALARISPSELVISGSHSHLGPSQMYGGLMYCAASSGFRSIRKNTRRLGDQIGDVARQAVANLVSGGAAIVRETVVGVASNRALPAWRNYTDGEVREFTDDGPGGLVSDVQHQAERMIDPRLTVLYVESSDGEQRGALGWYGVHGTALGPGWETYSADLFGWARHGAEHRLGDISVGFGGGTTGDMSPLPLDPSGQKRTGTNDRPSEPGLELATTVGSRFAQAMVDAVQRAQVEPFEIGTDHTMWSPAASGLPPPNYGMNQLGGGIDGPTGSWARLEAGVDSPRNREIVDKQLSEDDPHHPKTPFLYGIEAPIPLGWFPLDRLLRPLFPKRLPLHVIRIADHVFATVPGEPTTMSGWRIERAVLDATTAKSASVVGFANDYCGYWATTEEHQEQRYEGASTAFGRKAAAALTDELTRLARSVG